MSKATPWVDRLTFDERGKLINGLVAILTAEPDACEALIELAQREGPTTHFAEEIAFALDWIDNADGECPDPTYRQN